jgi:hypothetical protein
VQDGGLHLSEGGPGDLVLETRGRHYEAEVMHYKTIEYVYQ